MLSSKRDYDTRRWMHGHTSSLSIVNIKQSRHTSAKQVIAKQVIAKQVIAAAVISSNADLKDTRSL